MAETDVHLLRVTTDDREHQLWAAACSREKAIDRARRTAGRGSGRQAGWIVAFCRLIASSVRPPPPRDNAWSSRSRRADDQAHGVVVALEADAKASYSIREPVVAGRDDLAGGGDKNSNLTMPGR